MKKHKDNKMKDDPSFDTTHKTKYYCYEAEKFSALVNKLQELNLIYLIKE